MRETLAISNATILAFQAADKTLHRTWRPMGWHPAEAYLILVDTTAETDAIVDVIDLVTECQEPALRR